MGSRSSRETGRKRTASSEHASNGNAGGESLAGDIPDGTDVLSKDRIFQLLSVQRRRDVLEYLHEVEPETTLGTLAEHVAAKENEIDVQDLSAAQRKRVYVGLYQSHLPKLDDANVIDYDQDRGSIAIRPEAAQLIPYLRIDPFDGTPDQPEEPTGRGLRHTLKSFLNGRLLG